jgi:hypothetical protein
MARESSVSAFAIRFLVIMLCAAVLVPLMPQGLMAAERYSAENTVKPWEWGPDCSPGRVVAGSHDRHVPATTLGDPWAWDVDQWNSDPDGKPWEWDRGSEGIPKPRALAFSIRVLLWLLP